MICSSVELVVGVVVLVVVALRVGPGAVVVVVGATLLIDFNLKKIHFSLSHSEVLYNEMPTCDRHLS